MTIEEFRKRINAGPTADELKKGFEQRIMDIVNGVIDERDDIKDLKERVESLEKTIEKMNMRLDALSKETEPKKSKKKNPLAEL